MPGAQWYLWQLDRKVGSKKTVKMQQLLVTYYQKKFEKGRECSTLHKNIFILRRLNRIRSHQLLSLLSLWWKNGHSDSSRCGQVGHLHWWSIHKDQKLRFLTLPANEIQMRNFLFIYLYLWFNYINMFNEFIEYIKICKNLFLNKKSYI